MMLTRRALLATASAATASVPAWAQSPTPVRFQLGWIPNVEYSGLWLGMERGLFAKQGVAVQWFPGGPNAPAAPVMIVANKADLGVTGWFPFLDAVTRGNDLVVIAAVFPRNPLGIISLAKKPIRTAKDIEGSRILVQSATEKTAVDATLALAGLPVRWTQVPAGFSPEPLVSGAGDGYTAFSTNQTITMEKMGLVRDKDFFFASFDDMGFRSYGGIVICSRAWLDAHRAAAVGFVRGLIGGWEADEADPAAAPKLAVDKYGADLGLDLAQQTRQNLLQLPLLHYENNKLPLLALDRDLMAGPMYDAARAAGRKDLPPIDKIADFSIVAEAHKA